MDPEARPIDGPEPPAGARDPYVLGPGSLPTPFTADEIRLGCPDDRFIRMLVEIDGRPAFLRTNRFLRADAEGATLESQRLSLDGEPLAGPEAGRTTWAELQAHASFAAANTTRSGDTIETPLGSIACIRYVQLEGGETSTFWFDPSRPGMPIRYQAEEAGRVTSRVSVIEDRLP